MLLLPGNSSVAQRIQGSFVSEEEVRKVVAHWRRQAPEVTYVSGVEGGDGPDGDDHVTSSANAFSAGGDDDDEAMMRQAMELVVRSQLGSTSMLQRKLKVGFARAGRIMDLLEQRRRRPSEGSKARAVLMTVEEFELGEQAGRERVGWLEDSADVECCDIARPAGAPGGATRSRSGSARRRHDVPDLRQRPTATGSATCRPTRSSRCASTTAAQGERVVDDPTSASGSAT